MTSVHPGEAAYPRGDGSLVVLPPADLRADVVGFAGVPQSLAPFESAEAELEVFEGSKTSPLICPPEFSSTEKSPRNPGKSQGGTCALIPRGESFFKTPGGCAVAPDWAPSRNGTFHDLCFPPGPIARSSPRSSRTLAPMALRNSTLSRLQSPCLKLPLRSALGPPEPFAPPCIRHLGRPVTAACLQG
jgi:hypothetical protein